MPKNDPGFFNSGLILKNLLHNQFLVAVHLEGGATISGTLLGWDSEYLLVREDQNLQIVPMPKVLRIQVDLEEVMSAQALIAASDEPVDMPNGSAPRRTMSEAVSAAAPATERKPESKSVPESTDGKFRLDELVKNW